MINLFINYIEKIEEYLDKYIFLIHIYVKFNYFLISNYIINLQNKFYVWNSTKFVSQTWNTYNSKIYNFKSDSIFF